MDQTARNTFSEAPGPRLARVSDAPTSGFRIPVAAPNASSRPPRLPRFDLLQKFAYDRFESAQATLILIDLPGVAPRHASVALSDDGVHVHVHIIANAAFQTAPPGDYEATFEVSPDLKAEWISAIMDNGLLKIRIDQQRPEIARIEIATNEDELIWIE
jgi:HSP20 family molecular chaperone IbpA